MYTFGSHLKRKRFEVKTLGFSSLELKNLIFFLGAVGRVAEVAGKSSVMMEIRTPKTHKAKRVLEKRAPKLVSSLKAPSYTFELSYCGWASVKLLTLLSDWLCRLRMGR